MAILLVLLAAIGLAAVVYLGFEPQGRAGLIPGGLRAVAWFALGLLLIDRSCARVVDDDAPIVLLDASLSMGAAGGRWAEAKSRAAGLGEVELIGAVSADSAPTGGVSAVASALAGAQARGRRVWLVTDGELDDAAELTGDWWSGTGVALLPRAVVADLALSRVAGPDRVAVGDTLRLEVDVSGYGTPDRVAATVEVRDGTTRWASVPVRLSAGSGSAVIEIPVDARLGAGNHLLTVGLVGAADDQPATDRRLHAVRVLPTPGVVLVASPGSWESRFLFRALLDVGALPVRGYLAVDRNRWTRMGDFGPATATDVYQVAQRADVLVLIGDLSESFRRLRPRGRWDFPAAMGSTASIEGDWYLNPTSSSPIVGAFVGLPVDSFPPATALAPVSAGPRDWTGLVGQQNRRGVERPAIIGRDSAGRREVVVAAAGLWRWAFRGGQSDQAYRAYVAATLTWLLGGTDSVTGRARPIRAVVERGRPVTFERTRADTGGVVIDLVGSTGRRTDTLEFDGAGRAALLLESGRYEYRLAGGGSGIIGVEDYSRELLPRPVVVADRTPRPRGASERAPLRDRWWLFAIIIAALAGEWYWRRRAGLR